MVNENDFATKFTLDGSEGRRELQGILGDLRKLVPAAKQAGDAVDTSAGGMAKEFLAVASAIERTETMLDRMAASQARTRSAINVADARDAQATSNYVYGDDANKSKAAAAAQKVVNLEAAREVALRQQANRDLEAEQRRLLLNAQIEEVSNRTRIANLREEDRLARQIAADEARANQAALKAEQQRKAAIMDRARTERTAAGNTAAAMRASANSGSERTSAINSERAASLHDVSQINATRYALYDVSATAAIVGTAIAGVGIASIAAATQAESSFAQVERAMDGTDAEAMQLRSTLLDLTTQMPTSFDEIAGVAQLGAQLGVANQDLDDFSSTVTKFAATTNVSLDATGTAFGKLGTLLHVPASEFENLGSSIYEVGINSAATETEILSMSQQLAGAASAYGVTAQEVVGLSAAFSSLGVAPEAARGSITRIFGDIELGAAQGGAAMEPFANLLHKTTDEATALWKSDPGAFFDQLVKGLSEAQKQGNLLQAISSIGANDVRDINLLQRLATNSEFLTTQLESANKAYKDGTALSAGYDTIAGTLAAKLTELWNTVQKLAITAGGPFLGAIGGIVDFLKVFLDQLSGANPILLAVITGLALLAGGFVLLKSAQAAVLAGILALRFVLQQLGDASGNTGVKVASLRVQLGLLKAELAGTAAESRAAAAGMTTTGTAATGASRGMTAFGVASKAIGWAGLILLVGQFTGALLEANRASISAWQGINKVSTAADGAKLSMKEVADSFTQAKEQIYSFQGGNITDQFANALGSAFGMNDYVKQAQQEIAAVDDRLAEMVSNGNADKAAEQVKEFGISTGEIANFLPNYTAALDNASAAQDNQAASVAGVSEETAEYTSVLDKAKASVDALFSSLNQQSDFAGSIQTLFSGIYDAGDSFSYLNEVGRANLSNLQSAMAQTIAYAESTGVSATDSIASIFIALAQQGVNVDSLIRTMAASPYTFKGDIDMSAVQAKIAAVLGTGSDGSAKKTKDAYKPFSALDLQLNNLAISAPKAENGLSGTGTAAKKAASEAKKAAAEVRTLGDYVSDLQEVMSGANKYRFGVQDAVDDISEKWGDIRERIADSNKAMAEHVEDVRKSRIELQQYRADLAQLRSDLTQQQYFLKIAVQYGDGLRAKDISADIAETQAKIADKQSDIRDKQADISAPFDTGRESAAKQRQTLSDLVGSYQDLLGEYARSGMSQDQLKVKADQLRQQFIAQATQAGYSKRDIDRYTGAFDDMTIAIKNVPKNITVKANTQPALQALADFVAKAKKTTANTNVAAPGAGAAGTRAAKAFSGNFDSWMRNWNNSFNEWKKGLDKIQTNINNIKIPDVASTLEKIRLGGLATGGFVPGVNAFPIGGFVPGTTPSDRRKDNVLGMGPAGLVALQGGEPIINNAARSKYGDAMFNAINSLNYQPNVIRPQITVQGGSDNGSAEMLSYALQLLAEIRDRIGITISGSALEAAASAGNVSSNRRRAG